MMYIYGLYVSVVYICISRPEGGNSQEACCGLAVSDGRGLHRSGTYKTFTSKHIFETKTKSKTSLNKKLEHIRE